MSQLSSFGTRQANTMCRVFIILLLTSLIPDGVCVAQDPIGRAPVVLEEVTFLLFGRERQEVGEVQLLGEDYQIRLFDSRISTYYTVTIAAADLISTTRIPAENAKKILNERGLLITAREQLREQRRKERRERAAADSVRSPARQRAGQSSSTSQKPRTTRSSESPVSLRETVPSRSSLEAGKELLLRLEQVCEELLQRSSGLLRMGQGFQQSLKSWDAASEGNSRLFTNLREEGFSLVEKTESLEKQIRAREKEISWTLGQVESKDIRARDLPELSDRIRRRVLQCEEKLDSLEVLFSACSDGIKMLGDPIVKSVEAESESTTQATYAVAKNQSGKPTSSSAKSEPAKLSEESANDPVSKSKKPMPISVSRDKVATELVEKPDSAIADQDQAVESDTDSSPDSISGGVSTLLLGGILGALLVLILTAVIKRL